MVNQSALIYIAATAAAIGFRMNLFNIGVEGQYTLTGPSTASSRHVSGRWWLPSEDEWYKAAYFGPVANVYYSYPTGTSNVPDNNLPSADTGNSANYHLNSHYTTGNGNYPLTDVGAYTLSPSPYGTFDQGGNAYEWVDTNTPGILRGGLWGDNAQLLDASFRYGLSPASGFSGVGFRVATVPENQSPGDFNGDGRVDMADYVMWRHSNGPAAHYNLWRAHYGEPIIGSGKSIDSGAVPEPSSGALLVVASISALSCRRRKSVPRNRA